MKHLPMPESNGPAEQAMYDALLAVPEGAALPERPSPPPGASVLAWLIAAEWLRRSGAVLRGCEALASAHAALDCIRAGNEPSQAALHGMLATAVLRFVGEGQRLKQAGGGFASALEINEALLRAVPDRPEPLTELLIICLMLQPDIARCQAAAALLAPEVESSPWLHVLLGELCFRTGDWTGVRGHLAGASGVTFADASYAAWHAQLGLRLAVHDQAGGDPGEAAERLVAALAAYLKTTETPDSFAQAVLRNGVYNDGNIHDAYRMVSLALDRLLPGAGDEDTATILLYFHAINDQARFDAVMAGADSRRSLWTVPGFAKTVSRNAQRVPDSSLDETACGMAALALDQVPTRRLRHARVQAQELQARAQRLGIPVPGGIPRLPSLPVAAKPRRMSGEPTLFIGVFGQLRHEAETLPRLRAFLDAEIAKVRLRHPVAAHIGISVWDETGQRRIMSANGRAADMDVLFERLPPSFRTVCIETGRSDLAGFQSALPQTFAAAVAASNVVEAVDLDLIERHLGPVDQVTIGRQADFTAELDRLMASLFRRNAPNGDKPNQLRMWKRVAAFADQVAVLEGRLAGPIAGGMLIRADLLLGEGSIERQLLSILERGTDRRIWVDNDPAATFLEGVGDRYFIGGRTALLTVSHLWASLCAMADQAGGPSPEQAQRFLSHTLIGCFLFEQGISVAEIDAGTLPFRIHRGTLPPELIRAPFEQDLAAMDPGLAAAFAALMP